MKFADEFRDPAAARGLREGRCEVENQYSRVVRDEGNPAALVLMAEVFELRPRFEWRGLGFVSRSVVSPEGACAAYYNFGRLDRETTALAGRPQAAAHG